mmetsp:Transcript_40513/g.75928  ORF Transcript_40513/g.75928 Transcript_40513/m.75928 type:complete len:255 (+) Transcript_40513:37-801(+)
MQCLFHGRGMEGRPCKQRRVCGDLSNVLKVQNAEVEASRGLHELLIEMQTPRAPTPCTVDVKRFCPAGADESPIRRSSSNQDLDIILEEDRQMQLLAAMCRCFSQDCVAGRALEHGRAGITEGDVYMVFNRETSVVPPEVIGYIAMVNDFEHGVELNVPGLSGAFAKDTLKVPKQLPFMTQLYVEREYRRRGVATAALRMLFRGVKAVVVDAPSRPALLALESLKFKLVGARAVAQGPILCLFVRIARNDENRS